ncbi:MAG: peptidoglycan DD-metalloendopeptidase family protein [Thioalkalispiraceae bacterium]|jgi:lipoprotein NlpD
MLMLAGCVGPGSISSGYKVREHPFHVVSKGDTLYSIAWQAGHDYRKVARWNNISPPYRIHPGQRIYLTPSYYYDRQRAAKPYFKSKTYAKHPIPEKPASSGVKKKPAKARQKPSSKQVYSRGPITWAWPAKGKIVGYFSAKKPGKNGVDIAGRNGQAVKAAASGRVVYSGNGLRGYGNLVIIKHNETFFSAYAHNQRVYVKEDQKVKLGEKIADMGSTGTNKVMLHFEIRKNGRPINPLLYLPKS